MPDIANGNGPHNASITPRPKLAFVPSYEEFRPQHVGFYADRLANLLQQGVWFDRLVSTKENAWNFAKQIRFAGTRYKSTATLHAANEVVRLYDLATQLLRDVWRINPDDDIFPDDLPSVAPFVLETMAAGLSKAVRELKWATEVRPTDPQAKADDESDDVDAAYQAAHRLALATHFLLGAQRLDGRVEGFLGCLYPAYCTLNRATARLESIATEKLVRSGRGLSAPTMHHLVWGYGHGIWLRVCDRVQQEMPTLELDWPEGDEFTFKWNRGWLAGRWRGLRGFLHGFELKHPFPIIDIEAKLKVEHAQALRAIASGTTKAKKLRPDDRRKLAYEALCGPGAIGEAYDQFRAACGKRGLQIVSDERMKQLADDFVIENPHLPPWPRREAGRPSKNPK